MRESELHEHIYKRSADLAARFGSVVVGPGDDCAVVRVGGNEILLTVDQVVEGRHFAPGLDVDLIARKAVGRSISDIAAMAGTPAWALATGALPEGDARGDRLFDAMQKWARHWGAPLVGGDIAVSPKRSAMLLTVTVGGEMGTGRGPVLRSGARAGDELWVTGNFGGSLESGRHATFEPRLRESAWLRQVLGEDLHAMIDVSDGLGRDAGRIAKASGVKVEIEAGLVPRHEGVSDAARALGDGEDYELCFAVAAGKLASIARPEELAGMTRVGQVIAGTGCVAKGLREGERDVNDMGWEHE